MHEYYNFLFLSAFFSSKTPFFFCIKLIKTNCHKTIAFRCIKSVFKIFVARCTYAQKRDGSLPEKIISRCSSLLILFVSISSINLWRNPRALQNNESIFRIDLHFSIIQLYITVHKVNYRFIFQHNSWIQLFIFVHA